MKKEIRDLKRKLVSRSEMHSVIQKLTEEDDAIRWLIEHLEQGYKIEVRLDDTPDYQKPPNETPTLWSKIKQWLP